MNSNFRLLLHEAHWIEHTSRPVQDPHVQLEALLSVFAMNIQIGDSGAYLGRLLIKPLQRRITIHFRTPNLISNGLTDGRWP